MIPLSIIKEAFPNQPRMQQAFAATLQQADDLVTNLTGVAEALARNGGDITAALGELDQKQPLNSILTELAALPPDAGVPEQVQPGSWQIRPIDAEDTRSLITRQTADTRYLGGAHAAASATKLATARNIAITGDLAWSVAFDGSANVTAGGTIQSNAVTFSKFVAATQKALVGANAAGNFQEITIGGGLSLTAGVLSATGGGSVTSVSVVTANGVSGTVATPTTTPAITLTLGAITPSSVAATGTVTGSNLSGTNTGDQTTISGNAGTATKLATGRTIAMTGDVTWTSPSFDGTGNVTAAATVTRINGVALSGLTTGILKNTTGTGVPSIAVAGDFPTLNQSTTGSAASLTTPRTISITGKATAAGGTFDGTGNLALNVTAMTLVAGDIPNIAESQVTNLTTDLAAKAPLASPSFTGQVSVTGSGNDLVSVVGSGTGRSGFYAKASNSAGNATFYFENDRGGFASYGGVVTGGSTNANSFFGLTRADKTFLIHDGASGLGMGIGTLTNTPVVFGVNNVEVARLTSTGFSVTGTASATGGFTGNAATATKLFTARNINGVPFDGTANVTIPGSTLSVVTKTAGYTEATTSGEIIILASFAAGGTIVLPTAVGNTTKFTVKKLLSASTVVIDGNASETIDGGLTATLTNQYETISFVSDNANWWII